jgi:hypothetical protein
VSKLKKRLVGQLKKKGMSTGKAHAVATKTLQKSGNMKKGSTKLTSKGRKRQAMGASGRAKDRAAKASGRSTREYSYSKKTNRATLKKRKK